VIQSQVMRVLGLAEGASEADIRKAYAQRLKITHPEDNPEGFKELRQAYESALQYLRFRQQYPDAYQDESETDAEAAGSDPQITVETIPRQQHVPAAPLPVDDRREEPARLEPDENDLHAEACNRLGGGLQTGASTDELRAALEAVLTSPALANVDIYNRTEGWLIHVLASTAPASHPLLDRAIAFYQWNRVGDHRNQGPGAIVNMRARIPYEKKATEFIARVKDKRHEFHRAYKELTRPPHTRGPLSRVWALRREDLIDRFIAYITQRAPLAIESLDPEALAWWRKGKRGPLAWMMNVASSLSGIVAVAIVAVGILTFANAAGLLSRSGTSPSSQPRFEDASMIAVRAKCEREFEKVRTASSDTALLISLRNANTACQFARGLMPDSLLVTQHAGMIALARKKPDEAADHFDWILQFSPNDPYALFGKGLALSSPALMSEAIRRDPEVEAYFSALRVTFPVVTPMTETPKSRWIKPPRPQFDTAPKRIKQPAEKDIRDAVRHFGLTETPEGIAALHCLVDANGSVSECEILGEAPRNKGVGEFALRYATASTFSPATLKGVAMNDAPLFYMITLSGAGPAADASSALFAELRKRVEREADAARETAVAADAEPLPATEPEPVLSPDAQRVMARKECQTLFEGIRLAKQGQVNANRMAHAETACRRELGKAPESLLLRQQVAILALTGARPAEASGLFDEILAQSPNDPYALYGKGVAAVALDQAADTSIIAEARKRDPAVKAYFEKLPLALPVVAPMEGEPKSRFVKRPTPEADTRPKRLGDLGDDSMRAIMRRFGLGESPVGTALLDCLIRADGSVTDCVIAEEKPYNRGVGEFGVAMAYVSKFEPAKLDGQPVDKLPLRYTVSLVATKEELDRLKAEREKAAEPPDTAPSSPAPSPQAPHTDAPPPAQ
jgi:hypothetical protein